MKRKKALAISSLLMAILASVVLIGPTPPVSAQYPKSYRYIVMGGDLNSWTQLDGFGVSQSPFTTRLPRLTPLLMMQNITFSQAWDSGTYGWIVNLTIPHDTFVGVYHEWYDTISGLYFNLQNYMTTDGHGWVFLNDSRGDVDCYTFNNSTGSYWKSPSLKAGTLAAYTGDVPSVGPDGVAGTADDGFGDGTPDLKGSGVMIMPARLSCNWTDAPANPWRPLFDIDWPLVLTSGTAYDIVIDATSAINGKNATVTGWRWEFLAGVQGSPPYKGPVPYDHPKWNAFNKVACAWSMINITTATYGRLDVMFYLTEKVVRADCVVADVDCNQVVNILDILVASVCFGAEDEALGKPSATRGAGGGLFDARADLAAPRGLINVLDILKMSVDFGKMITPQCIIRP